MRLLSVPHRLGAVLVFLGLAPGLNAEPTTPAGVAADPAGVAFIRSHALPPEDYVLSKFKDHDVVYLGESPHGIKPNLEFLQRLIARLPQAGVHDLAYEMALAFEQDDVDALVRAPAYDESKALTLLFHWDAGDGWAFREYADVFRAAWRVNRRLGAGALRILAMDYRPDWSLVRPGDPIMDRVTRWRAWAGSNQITRNVTMADLILRELVAKKRKVLVFGGYGHTPLGPTLDKREESGMRFSAAYLMRRRIGDRITAIRLAADRTGWPALDAVLDALPADRRAVGVDLRGTPLGALPYPETAPMRPAVEGRPATLADETEGLVCLGEPAEPVTLAPGFLTEDLVARARKEGWLPDVPAVTLDWVRGNAERIARPRPAPP